MKTYIEYLKENSEEFIKEEYQSDEDIADGYRNWTISDESSMDPGKKFSGTLIFNIPEEPDCDECPIEQIDNFLIYDFNGSVVFDHWYPPFLVDKIKVYIYENLIEDEDVKKLFFEANSDVIISSKSDKYNL